MPAHDPSQRTYDRDAYRLDESAVKEWLDRNGATLADAMGKALKSATFGRADTPILSISVNLLQQSGAAGESKTVSELEPTLSDAVIATVNAETEDPLQFLISQLDSDKRFSQSYERAESLGVSEAVLDDITDRLASGELSTDSAVAELEAKARQSPLTASLTRANFLSSASL